MPIFAYRHFKNSPKTLIYIAMKTVLLPALFLIISHHNIYATASRNDDNSNSRIILYKNFRNGTNKPRSPELMKTISCVYSNYGELSIEFDIPEGQCYLYVEHDTGGTFDYFFDSADPINNFFIGRPGSFTEAYITITTESGNEYFGVLTFY